MTFVQRNAAEQFEEGLNCAAKGEHDQATSLLADCVAAEPANLDFVAAFLQNVRQRQPATPCASKPDDRLARAVVNQEWTEVTRIGPPLLVREPKNLPTLVALAEAAGATGNPHIELQYLELALEFAPDNVDAGRRAGRCYFRLRRTDEALACWQRVESLEPGDAEAVRMTSKLTIAKSRERVGLPRRDSDSAEDAADQHIAVAKAKRSQELPERIWRRQAWESLAAPSPNFQRTPIQQLEAAVREHPANPEPYLELASLYLERDRDYDAERMLARGREATAGDLRILELWESVVMRRLEKKVTGAREAAEAEDTPQSRAALEAARDERDRLETEILASRCRREPMNAAVRYQLGLRLKRAGKLREACASFQQALADSTQKAPAALAMGECHEELHEIPEALKHYRLAADSAHVPAQLDCKKQSLYDAGRLVTGMNLPRLAERYLGELLRLEPEHLEAARLLARLRPVEAPADGNGTD